MDPVDAQYEAYPYPARDPAEEASRLLRGSPSDPLEIDHFLFAGRRDWSKPFRALVAGGGAGDATVMLAQLLADLRCPAEIVHLDRSRASTEIAEARVRARGLSSVRFLRDDLRAAPDLAAKEGAFDYIDCCGVLHHLEDPQAGMNALAAALAEGGGLGAMVYAPYGRAGVYELQAALAALTDGLAPAAKVAAARRVLERLPPTNGFRRNPFLGDHATSDAGLYDLLLHARDRPFRADEVIAMVERAGLAFVSFLEPARYDPGTWIGDAAAAAAGLSAPERAALGERLAGGIKAHVFYAARGAPRPARLGPEARPRLRGAAPAALAAHVASGKPVTIPRDGARRRLDLPRSAAPALRLLDGRRRMGEVAAALGMDWVAFAAAFAPAHRALEGASMLLFSESVEPPRAPR